MGYTTEFEGSLQLSKQATPEQIKYLNTFCGTRRMKRDVNILQEMYKGEYGFNGSYGREGEYFAKNDGEYGQKMDKSIIDYNEPPCNVDADINNWKGSYQKRKDAIENGEAVPGLWCQWQLNEDGTELEWDGGEKFYYYTEWLKYLIKHFFSVWGIELNGTIKWRGEDFEDMGKIEVKNNIVTVKELSI